MKKNIAILVLAVLLCTSFLLNGYLYIQELGAKDIGTFGKGDEQYGDNDVVYDKNFQGMDRKINKETALKIANAVLTKGKDESQLFKETEYRVYDYKNYYVVERGEKLPRFAGGIEVAINKKDGKILKIWAEE